MNGNDTNMDLPSIINNTIPISESNNILPHGLSPIHSLSIKTLITILLLLFYITAGRLFETLKIYFIHESGLCMLLGMAISIIVYGINPNDSFTNNLKFDDALFFNFILPPIIFSAGYNLKCKNFFMYFHYSILFGIIGTAITLFFIAFFTYTVNSLNIFEVNFSGMEILLFSSVISATDTVTPLAFLSEDNHNKLFTVLFGEGIMNDSFSIVIYQILSNFYNTYTTTEMLGYFIYLFIMSLILGICIGFICSLVLKHTKHLKLHRHQEISILLLFAFISYSFAEALNLSAVISLLFCSIALSNYAFYNLSFIAREESCVVVKILSSLSEAFVFTYLGLTFFSMAKSNYSIIFIIFEFSLIIAARFFTSYLLTGITNLFSSDPFLPIEKKVISFAGCIRGAISFGLAMSIKTGNTVSENIILTSTLVLVFGSTIIFGALIPIISKNIYASKINAYIDDLNESYYLMPDNESRSNSRDKNNVNYGNTMMLRKSSFKYEHPNLDVNHIEDNPDSLSGMGKVWFSLDKYVLKPIFVYDWENTIKEHIYYTKKVKKVIDNPESNEHIN